MLKRWTGYRPGETAPPVGLATFVRRVGVGAVLVLMSCGPSTGPSDGGPLRIDPAWVVGPVARAVGPDGLLVLSNLLPTRPGEISLAAAQTLADAVIRFVGGAPGGLREYIVGEHGAPIDFATLRRCGRATPHWTNLADPGPLIPQDFRTSLGDSYFLDYCKPDRVTAVTVEVYVRTEARVRDDGTIQFPPPPGGTQFTPRGVPLHGGPDLSPEFAIQRAFAMTGLRISEVPELDGCLNVIAICTPYLGIRWRVTVERKVRIKLASGAELDTDQFAVQVGYGAREPGGVYAYSPVQPGPTWQQFDRTGGGLDSTQLRLVRPLALEPFFLVR